jgi:DNA polymerase-3 subunit beta
MEFRIDKAEFLTGLRIAQGIADRKSTMPMLANVLLRTSGKDKVLVSATDLNTSILANLVGAVQAEGGLTLNARALHDIISNMPNEQIVLRRIENSWAEIRAGKVSYRLVGMADRDFPKTPDYSEPKYSTISATLFHEMIDRTIFSVCNDETRFHLNGVLFESDGKVGRMVATDGHRLAKIERRLEGAPVLSTGVIIPKNGLLQIRRALDAVESCQVAIKTPYIFLLTDKLHLAVKLIESQFPPYEKVIPVEHEKRAVVDRGQLLEALKRAQLMSSETRGVKFSFSQGAMLLTSDNPDVGEVKEELDVDYEGQDLSIGFNGKYVIDFLGAITADKVALELKGELDPGLLRPVSADDAYLGVVMPMRI